MGSVKDDSDGLSRERPSHDVTVSDFYIGKFPVTQALWRAVVTAPIDGVASSHPVNKLNPGPSRFQGDERPVEQVSWDDAQLFIQKLNEITKTGRLAGYHYYLPTEAEWEYAARGGKFHTEGYKYSGSDRLKDVGWFKNNSGKETKSVGLKYPNQLDIHDMSGNVWEWCEDDWHGDYKGAPKNGSSWIDNPRGSSRVVRGGGWGSGARSCRAAYRGNGARVPRDSYLGFRLALTPQSVGRPVPAFL
ncbi:MAG: formylglycine-generating enzyme family protein [Lewinellaceae bacterium]|nr:formylglycine-generating enzyme family protein [Lewinellaceae bacterium]